MSWFWSSSPNNAPVKERQKKEITLSQKDDDLTRAEKILISAGIVVNDTVQSVWLPWMARTIVTYQELDKERWRWEWEQEQKKDKEK